MVRLTWLLALGVGLLACGEVMGAPTDALTDKAGLEDSSNVPLAPSSSVEASPSPSPASSSAPADAGCALEHHNGAGQTYLSCAPLGTTDEDAATRACLAYVAAGGATGCASVTLKTSTGDDCRGVAIMSTGGGATCTWGFGGLFPGRVAIYGSGWGCPKSASPTWN